MVCSKTLYNYIDIGLLEIKNTDLPEKMHKYTKAARVKARKKILGKSIKERAIEIESREEFSHWEIDTVIGKKSSANDVLLTIVERKTRYLIVKK